MNLGTTTSSGIILIWDRANSLENNSYARVTGKSLGNDGGRGQVFASQGWTWEGSRKIAQMVQITWS